MKSSLLIFGVSILSVGLILAQELSESLTDPRDREMMVWLTKRLGGTPKLGVKGGRPERISLEGMEKGSASVILDEEGRVTGFTSNGAGLNNDDLAQLAGFRHITLLRNDHNFDDQGPNGYRQGPNPMSGAGWIAFKDHGITNFRIAGCNFDGDGLRAVAQFPQLKHLDVFHTRVNDVDLEAIKGHPTLEFFFAGPMWDDKITNKTLAILGTLPSLTSFRLVETYVSYEGGFDQIVKFGDQLTMIDLGNTVVPPADLERLRKELPNTEIKQESMAAIGKLILENWKGADRTLSKWAPSEVLDLYRAAAK